MPEKVPVLGGFSSAPFCEQVAVIVTGVVTVTSHLYNVSYLKT